MNASENKLPGEQENIAALVVELVGPEPVLHTTGVAAEECANLQLLQEAMKKAHEAQCLLEKTMQKMAKQIDKSQGKEKKRKRKEQKRIYKEKKRQRKEQKKRLCKDRKGKKKCSGRKTFDCQQPKEGEGTSSGTSSSSSSASSSSSSSSSSSDSDSAHSSSMDLIQRGTRDLRLHSKHSKHSDRGSEQKSHRRRHHMNRSRSRSRGRSRDRSRGHSRGHSRTHSRGQSQRKPQEHLLDLWGGELPASLRGLDPFFRGDRGGLQRALEQNPPLPAQSHSRVRSRNHSRGPYGGGPHHHGGKRHGHKNESEHGHGPHITRSHSRDASRSAKEPCQHHAKHNGCNGRRVSRSSSRSRSAGQHHQQISSLVPFTSDPAQRGHGDDQRGNQDVVDTNFVSDLFSWMSSRSGDKQSANAQSCSKDK